MTKAFRGLKQDESVETYIDRFEDVMTLVKIYNHALKERYFLDYFILGLKTISRFLLSL